jgi:kojibiose phosphorylase
VKERDFLPNGDSETWQIRINGFHPLQERAVESLMAIGNGYIGSRASLPEGHPASNPGTFIAGVFEHSQDGASPPELARAPDWFCLTLTVDGEILMLDLGEVLDHTRELDLRSGLWKRDWRDCSRAGRITDVRFQQCVSLDDRHVLLQRIEITPENYSGEVQVQLRLDGRYSGEAVGEAEGPCPAREAPPAESRQGPQPLKPRPLIAVQAEGSGIGMAFASAAHLEPPAAGPAKPLREDGVAGETWTWQVELGRTYRIDRLVAAFTSRDSEHPSSAARARVEQLFEDGADALLAKHASSWAERWEAAGITLPADPPIEKALRLAAYHLTSSANAADERSSIGARGLTGEAYRGHVFWDTEVFMLPFFVFTNPPVARTLLMYRFHTLPAAREKARGMGYRGALYAWESADTGEEVTPKELVMPGGAVLPVLCGELEHHISADVAYAVWQYWWATHDEAFFREAGAEIMLETARFWASRARQQGASYVIRGVIGPDEYHEDVDNNAYTNLMARWNLLHGRKAAQLVSERWPEVWQELCTRLGFSEEETKQWEHIAQGLVLLQDAETGIIEQFEGYHGLDEIDLLALGARTLPVDLMLGHERTMETKVIKQADVLMALALLPDAFDAAVHKANFEYYEPRTAHGSSLSPGIHALVAARAGDLGRAERYLRQTAAIDLDDQMANASGGVHMAALGSLWQAVVFGFAGVHLLDGGLALRPRLASRWHQLRIPLQWRGRRLLLDLQKSPLPSRVRLVSGPPLIALSQTGAMQRITQRRSLRIGGEGERWELREEVDR